MVLKVREALARRRMTREALAEQAQVSGFNTRKGALGPALVYAADDGARRGGRSASSFSMRAAVAMNTRADGVPAAAGRSRARSSRQLRARRRFLARRAVPDAAPLVFADERAIFAYRTDIFWSDEASQLEFREAERLDHDYTQFGAVSVPHQSGAHLLRDEPAWADAACSRRPALHSRRHAWAVDDVEVGSRRASFAGVAADCVSPAQARGRVCPMV